MKKYLLKIILLVIVILLISASTSFAARLTDNSVLSQTLEQGETQLDMQIAYSVASEILTGDPYNLKWESLRYVGLDSLTYLYIPVRLTYGLIDKLSLRLTIPYASIDAKSPISGMSASGSGLANIEFESLYELIKGDNGASSLYGLLGVKLGTGKKLSELKAEESYVGTRSTDVMLAGILSKKFGAATGKMLLGYLFTNPYKEQYSASDPEFDVNLTDQIVYSLALMVPMEGGFEISGEFMGALSQGEEEWSLGSAKYKVPNSSRSYSMFTPAFAYRAGDRFTLRGEADLLLQKSAAFTLNTHDLFKFNTYTISGTLLL